MPIDPSEVLLAGPKIIDVNVFVSDSKFPNVGAGSHSKRFIITRSTITENSSKMRTAKRFYLHNQLITSLS